MSSTDPWTQTGDPWISGNSQRPNFGGSRENQGIRENDNDDHDAIDIHARAPDSDASSNLMELVHKSIDKMNAFSSDTTTFRLEPNVDRRVVQHDKLLTHMPTKV